MARRILYTCKDSPPGRAVEMALHHLDLAYEVKEIVFEHGEHFSESFLKMYPQGEIPVLDDFGFIVGESVAILQYLASKYPRDEHFYPKDPEKSSIVHHCLAFHLSTYYRRIHDYIILPMDYAGYEKTSDNEKKLNHALKIFNEILRRQNIKQQSYAAGDKVSIADLPLIMGTVVLIANDHDLTPFPNIVKWFENFKKNQKELWSVAQVGLDALEYYRDNPRDMTNLKHPIHPTTKSN